MSLKCVSAACDGLRAVARFFVRRPRLATVIAGSFALAGGLALVTLPTAQYPTVAPPSVSLSCSYSGANAGEVMNTVAGPLENQVNGVEDMLYMSSSCSDSGSYSLTVNFELGTDRDFAMMKVQNLAQQALSLLPQEVKNSGLTVTTGSSEKLGLLTLSSPGGKLSFEEISDYVFGVIHPAMQRVPGVGKATVKSVKRAVRVWLDPKKLAALGVNAEEVVSAVRQQNVQASIGSVGASPTGDATCRMVPLVAKGRLTDRAEFEKIVVRTRPDGTLVRIGDVGRVDFGLQSYDWKSYLGEAPAVQIWLYQLPGTDVGQTMRLIKQELKNLERSFPGDMKWEMTLDMSRTMYANLRTVAGAVGAALVVALVVALVAFRSLRAALVPALLVPASLLGAFAALAAFGRSLDVLTTLALVLALGLSLFFILAVVSRTRAFLAEGLAPTDAAEAAGAALTPTLALAALLALAAFVPVGFVSGLTGAIYRPFALVLAATSLTSAVNALFVAPALSARLLRPPKRPPREGGRARALLAAPARLVLARPSLALAVVALAALAAAWFAGRVPSSLVPAEDNGVLSVNCRLNEGTSIAVTERECRRLARRIGQIPGVKATSTLCGESDIGGAGENQGLVTVILDDWSRRKDPSLSENAIRAKINALEAEFPNVSLHALPIPTVPGMGSAGGVSLIVLSQDDTDPVRLARTAHRIRRRVAASPLFDVVSCGYQADTPHLRVKVDRDKCQLHDVPVSSLFTTLQYYLGSLYVNDVNLGTQVNRVTVASDWEGRATPEAVGDLFVRNAKGAMIPVNALVTADEELGPRVIYRYNQYVYCTVDGFPKSGVSTGDAIRSLRRIVDEEYPPDYGYGWSGLTFHEMRGQGNGLTMIIVALLGCYLLLVARFESWRLPLAVMLPSLCAVAGAVGGLWLVGAQLSIFARLGVACAAVLAMVSALGVVGAAEAARTEGCDAREAARAAVRAEFAPAALALGVFALATVPLLFTSGIGGNAVSSLGVALLAGVVGQLVVGLPLVPALFSLVRRVRQTSSARMESQTSMPRGVRR